VFGSGSRIIQTRRPRTSLGAAWLPPAGRPRGGLGAGVGGQLAVRHELAAAGLLALVSEFEINWIGPTILKFGSDEQRIRYLWPLLETKEMWCRLHSEPDAGSDLAMITTRAEQTSDGFRINGQKVWTFNAERAHFGALLARTSGSPGDPNGISYFVLPMDSPGLTIVPIRDLSGVSLAYEVFLDDVEVAADHLIGELGEGLRIRRPSGPFLTVSVNPGLGAGHEPPVLNLLDLAAWDEVPSSVGDKLLDLYLESQSIDALGVLDCEEDYNAGTISLRRADVRRWLSQEFWRAALELAHDVPAEAESFARRVLVERLDKLGLGRAGTILWAPIATLPNGGSDIHLEAVTARLLGGGSPVLTAWAGEPSTPDENAEQVLGDDYEMLRTSLRRFCNDLARVDPLRQHDATALRRLALHDLLSTNVVPDVDWLAWLVSFEELGPSPIGAGLLASVGFGAVMLHMLGGNSIRAAELRDAALSGDIGLALAIQEPGPGWTRGDFTTKAAGNSKPRLQGSKVKVAYASAADMLVVVGVHDGRTHVYGVDPAADGVTLVDEPTVGPSLGVSVLHLGAAPALQLSDGDSGYGSLVGALSFFKLATPRSWPEGLVVLAGGAGRSTVCASG
jgi:alkylation response protein AidB-like acyl-CoA dehydrogenase